MTTTTDRAAALRDEAASVLAPIADLAAPVAPGADAPWDELVRVSEHQARLAASCPASLAYETDFDGWRAAFARRRIGRSILERMRKGATLDPGSIARAVVADAVSDGRDGLSQWLGSLGPGGLAAVVREATTWAVSARAEIRTWPPAPGTRFDAPPAAYAWNVPRRAVRLEATADGVVRGSGLLLLFATSTPSADAARREVCWLATIATLATGTAPASVTRVDLASGDRRSVPVTDDVLDHGLTTAVATVEAAVAARFTAPAEPTPGRWCRTCNGRDGCGPGGAWLLAQTGHLGPAP